MRAIIVSFLLIVNVGTSAQINIICPKLIDSSLNYFYIGIDNPIEIVGLKILPEHTIAISGAGATLFYGNESKYTPGNSIFAAGENRYIIRTWSSSDSCFISIYKGKKKIFSKRFISIEIPGPDLAIANRTGMFGKTISMDTLFKYPFLSVISPDCWLRGAYTIISFMVTIDRSGADSIYVKEVRGNSLTGEQIEYIKKSGRGTFMTIENIRCIGPDDGRTRKLTPLIINIE